MKKTDMCHQEKIASELDLLFANVSPMLANPSPMLCETLKYAFNLSIETGVFPDKLKIARVSPVYKAGDAGDLTNYRPIFSVSLLFPNSWRE